MNLSEIKDVMIDHWDKICYVESSFSMMYINDLTINW
jgi:hypothetical protein